MQQTMLDVSHEPFPKLLHDTVLAPIDMTHSTDEQPLPAAMQSNAAAHLFGAAGAQHNIELFPESSTRVFAKIVPLEIDFVKNDKDEITGILVHQGGQHLSATKTK